MQSRSLPRNVMSITAHGITALITMHNVMALITAHKIKALVIACSNCIIYSAHNNCIVCSALRKTPRHFLSGSFALRINNSVLIFAYREFGLFVAYQ